MKKNVSTPKSNLEDRMLGVEQRLTRLEETTDKVHWKMTGLEVDFHQLGKSFIKMEDRFAKDFEEFRSKIYNLLDPIAGQLKKSSEEQAIHAGQHQEVYEKVEKLEKIHPKFSHTAI